MKTTARTPSPPCCLPRWATSRRKREFFAKMATAGYRSRECGHTGQGFSYLWSALGANAGGPAAAAAFFKEASWHLDLVRRCDGSFTYDGGEQYGAGQTDDNTYYGKSSYNGLSPTATYVLTYSLPLKKLVITGRDANPSGWLDKKEAAAAVASGRFDLDRREMTPEELVAAFGDWSPIVRGWAAEELAKRPEAQDDGARAHHWRKARMRIRSRVPARRSAHQQRGGPAGPGATARPRGPLAALQGRAGHQKNGRRPPSPPCPTSSRRSSPPRNPCSRSSGPIPSSSPTASWPPPCSPAR